MVSIAWHELIHRHWGDNRVTKERKMPANRPSSVAAAPRTRSAVSNGKRLFVEQVDRRSAIGRRFADVLSEIETDLGGRTAISEGERQLARRCATLSVHAETMEAALVSSGQFDLEAYATLTNALGRALSRIGLQRRTRDITPVLSEYIAGQAGAAE